MEIDIKKLIKGLRNHVFQILNIPYVFTTPIKIIDDNSKLAYCDDRIIYFSKTAFNSTNIKYLTHFFIHELFHIMFKHCERGQNIKADVDKWNYVCDYIVEKYILEINKKLNYNFKIYPIGIIPDSNFDLIDNNTMAEILYRKLCSQNMKNEEEQKIKQMFDSFSGFDDILKKIDDNCDCEYCDNVKESNSISKDIENELNCELFQRNFKEKIENIGSNIGNFLRNFNISTNSNCLNYKKLLFRFFNRIRKGFEEYSFAVENMSNIIINAHNKKKNLKKIKLPGRYSTKKEINVIIDISGSICDSDLNMIMTNIENMILNKINCHIFTCDVECKYLGIIKDKKDLKNIKIIGGGGTDLRNAFYMIENDKRFIKNINIFLTDGYSPFPNTWKYGKVFFIITSNNKEIPKYGKVFYI